MYLNIYEVVAFKLDVRGRLFHECLSQEKCIGVNNWLIEAHVVDCWVHCIILNGRPHTTHTTDDTHSHTPPTLFTQSAQIAGVLYQIKDDPNILEDILKEVSSQYSPQLSKLIRMCLIRAFEQRPSSEDLVKLPYSQECLGLSSSHLYKGASKGQSTRGL